MSEVSAADVRRIVSLVMKRDDFKGLYNNPTETDFFATIYSVSVANLNEPLPVADLVVGLAQAAESAGWGLWLDHAEGALVQPRCRSLIERQIGRPEHYYDSPEQHDFHWQPNGDLASGLEAFDQWLQDNENGRFRLIEIDTGSDFFLSVLSPAEDNQSLIDHLHHCGLDAQLQQGDTTPKSH